MAKLNVTKPCKFPPVLVILKDKRKSNTCDSSLCKNKNCKTDIETLKNNINITVEKLKNNPELNQRWVNIGNTDLEKGILSLQNAI